MQSALDDLRVIEMTHVLAGPFCGYQLALLGADTIKIETPQNPDCARGRGPDAALNSKGLGLNYQVQGGNKRSLALDIFQPEGREILLQLLSTADVLIENYSTGVLDELGLSYAIVSKLNPRLVYCSMSGYGATGEKADKGAYDNTIQATSGLIAQSGGVKPGVSVVDYAAGYSASFAILAALLQRVRTGTGTHISASMLEVAMTLMAPEASAALHSTKCAKVREAGISAYETSGGRIMLGAFTPSQYGKLKRCFDDNGISAWFLSDIHNWEDIWSRSTQITAHLAPILLAKDAQEWVKLFRHYDVPAEEIIELDEAVKATQLAQRGYFVPSPEDENLQLPIAPFQMSEGGPRLHTAPPTLGQHSHQVLTELGLDSSRIELLKASGVVQ
ncbi:Succinyl-CoA:(R)-benzylsuccinate CoA-transferase subunit BbsF [Pseudovibrio axinellae]|uniref:Succinyl-CoA:(R)-benzylsuccinate CoA-transferase subunit BbsF n=1 Tax=Pseudovibrio axinellae TaxID=989403 RepID=A0A166BD29_9HYPH|nr:CoA transferase [Pseudovibrio axinellae]KZL22141.1 Succinyl-CoA:(R)-benzylsuccinate CoA-transferase subunit BbsF [Pseudovibrio axinellae]SEQ53656.1 Crotonobetainyl-CoA:carnitine CoA-transferase CaiB [Pseudovibrio axinellae]